MLSQIRKTAKKYTRRVLQGVHGNKKSSKEEDEKEFSLMFTRFQDIEKNLRQFHEHVEGYSTALRDSCALQANISGDLLYFFDAQSQNRVHADKYHDICTKMHLQRWAELSKTLNDHVLTPLEKHLQLFPTVKEMVKKRKRKLTDVQSYRRQVLSMTKSGKSKNAEKFKKKSEKLSQAEAVFQRIHNDLINILDSYDKSKEDLLVQYTYTIMHAQHDFLDGASNDTKPLKDISELFKKNSEERTKQIEDRLSQMVELFKRGEYASDAAIPDEHLVPTKNSHGRSRTRSLSPMATDSSRRLGTSTAELRTYLNSPMDTSRPFETLHRMWAPSAEVYQEMKLKGDSTGGKCEVVYPFEGEEENELQIEAGDVISVLERRDGGWWLGTLQGVKGLFPCNHVRPHFS